MLEVVQTLTTPIRSNDYIKAINKDSGDFEMRIGVSSGTFTRLTVELEDSYLRLSAELRHIPDEKQHCQLNRAVTEELCVPMCELGKAVGIL